MSQINNLQFLSGGGEMGKLTREKDWSKTKVGDPQHWPQSLRTTLSILLNSKFPMFLFWGQDHICFYNDAYRPSLGNEGKHPNVLGSPAEEYWQEIWPTIKPLMDQVLAGGEATWSEDQLIPIYRNGRLEDVYWTFSYSPVNDESGKPAGVFVTCSETTDKVLTLKKVEESNRKYLNNILQAPIAMCIYRGPSHVVEIANDLMLEIWNKKIDQVINKPIFDALPEAKGQGLEKLMDDVFNTGIKFVANERPVNLTRNGKIETTYINFVHESLKEPDGTISGIVTIATDVSAQVMKRKKVEESDQKLRSLIESAPFPIGVYAGKDLRIELANESIIQAWGKGNDVLGKSFIELLPELKGQQVVEQLLDVLSTGIPFHAANQYLDLVIDGTAQPYYYNYSFTPVLDAEGKVYGVMNTASDVTDLNVTKKKVEESEKDLQNMVLQSPIGICILDAKTLITEIVNESFIEVAGKKYEEITGKFYWDTFAEARVYYEDALKDVVKTGKAFYANEVEMMLIRHGKEEIIYVTFVYAPLKDAEGKVKKVVVWVLENTPQVIARKEIEKADKRFRNTVRQAPIGITILRGDNYMVEMANDAYLEIVDRKENEFVGRPLFDSLPEVEATVRPLLAGVLNSGVPFNGLEYPIPVNRYGKYEISYFDFLYHPLREEDGSISGIIVTVTDVTASVKTKHFISENEKQFRNMIMDSPIPMTIFRGKDFIIEIANNIMFKNIWRKKEEDVLGKKLFDVFPELIGQKYPDLLNQVFTTGILHKENESPVLVQGDDELRSFYLDYEYAPLFEPDGKVSGIMITVNDVTEKVQSRKKVEKSEKEFRQLADSLPELVWTTDANGVQTFASKRWKEFTGLDPYDEASFEQMVYPDDLQSIINTWTNCLSTGDKYQTQVRLKSKQGDYQWFYVHGEPLKDEDGNINKWVGSFTNFNEQKKAEQELIDALLQIEESEARFKNVANNAPVLIWMAGIDKRYNFFNKEWLKFTGHTIEQEKDTGWTAGIHPEDIDRYIQTFTTAFDRQEEFYIEYRLKRYDGAYRWMSDKAVPRFKSDKIFEGYIGACMDIQEIKEQDEQKDFFISMASHELKTPITSIKGYIQILKNLHNNSEDAFLKNSLNIINKQVLTLTNLISDMLDLSKMKSDSLSLNKENFEMTGLVNEIVTEIRHIHPDRTIVVTNLAEANVIADKERIGQVLINFLTNAVKYSNELGEIKIATAIKGNDIIVSVKDSGIGISKIDQQKIFERFYRVEGKNEKTFPGFGIGLFIASEIIRRHDGKIGVESETGEGSMFYFSLPIISAKNDLP